jgi:hypothetical protein
MGKAKGAGRVVLRKLGWTAEGDVPRRWWLLVEAGVLFLAWQNYAVGTMPNWYTLPLACLMSVIYGLSWASRLRNWVRRLRGSGVHRKDVDSL